MIEVNEFTLPNGLRVLHNFDPATAMVAVDVMYNVGSRDEDPEMTGMAHLFEHLMFGGSENIPHFDIPLQGAGGRSNAWTSNDFTNFYDVLPAVNIETALWLESDRMKSLAFSDKALEVQRSVVIEEFKQVCLNQPYGDFDHKLREMVWKEHPYRFPVIGKDFSHIEKVTQDNVRRWFSAHYAPNNAVVAICGNISFERTRELVEKWFGDIPARSIAPRLYSDEKSPESPREVVATGNVPQTMLTMAYPMDGFGTKGYYAGDLVSDVLANGRSSRFYRRLLLGTDLFSEVDASILGSVHPGLMLVSARLRDNGPEAEQRAKEAIASQIDELKDGGVTDNELERCVTRLESERTFSLMDCLSRAQSMARSAMLGVDINGVVPRYREVTADDIRDEARKIFDPSREMTLIYRPEE